MRRVAVIYINVVFGPRRWILGRSRRRAFVGHRSQNVMIRKAIGAVSRHHFVKCLMSDICCSSIGVPDGLNGGLLERDYGRGRLGMRLWSRLLRRGARSLGQCRSIVSTDHEKRSKRLCPWLNVLSWSSNIYPCCSAAPHNSCSFWRRGILATVLSKELGPCHSQSFRASFKKGKRGRESLKAVLVETGPFWGPEVPVKLGKADDPQSTARDRSGSSDKLESREKGTLENLVGYVFPRRVTTAGWRLSPVDRQGNRSRRRRTIG